MPSPLFLLGILLLSIRFVFSLDGVVLAIFIFFDKIMCQTSNFASKLTNLLQKLLQNYYFKKIPLLVDGGSLERGGHTGGGEEGGALFNTLR